MRNARDCHGVVHEVWTDDDGNHGWGQVSCGRWFFWLMSPLDEVERHGTAEPMNPTKERVTCLTCLVS